MASKKGKGGSLRQSLAGLDDLAPNEHSLDFDPELEDLGADVSLKRGKGQCRIQHIALPKFLENRTIEHVSVCWLAALRFSIHYIVFLSIMHSLLLSFMALAAKHFDDNDDHASNKPSRSALRAAASSVALEDDPKYAGKVVSVRALSQQRAKSSAQPARAFDDDDSEDYEDDDDNGNGVAEEDDEEIDEDELDGNGDDDDEDDDAGDDDDEDGDDDDNDAPEETGVRQLDSLKPRQSRSAHDDGDDDDEEEDALPSKARKRSKASSSSGGGLLRDIDAELAALESADAAAVSLQVRAAEDDAAKGRAVKDASQLYESVLEARIRLQPTLAASVQLPSQPVQEALSASSSELAAELSETRKDLAGLLGDFLRLRAATLSRLPEVASEALSAGRKRRRSSSSNNSDVEDDDSDMSAAAAESALLPNGLRPLLGKRRRRSDSAGSDSDDDSVRTEEKGSSSDDAGGIDTDALWASMQAAWDAFKPYRNDALERWGRKLTYASGLSAKAALKLKVLSTSVPQQVAQMMSGDKGRLLARTRPLAATVRVLGSNAQPSDITKEEGGGEGSSGTSTAARYADAFDDADFYASLLKEYVASASSGGLSGGASGNALAAGQALIKKNLPRRVREGIDRRATKGRRLKFTVQPKLVAFMAPAPYVVPPELAYDIDTIVSSLFKT